MDHKLYTILFWTPRNINMLSAFYVMRGQTQRQTNSENCILFICIICSLTLDMIFEKYAVFRKNNVTILLVIFRLTLGKS